MGTDRTAIAVFVKTPGLSPVKTRLAEQIGRDAAEQFYDLSLAAIEATVAQAAASSNVVPHWAVAEEAGLNDPRWQRWPSIGQGTGSLGDRLGHVFAALRQEFVAVIAIGADSPQITPDVIRRAVEHLIRGEEAGHVLGRCHDGGFYLVGTNVAVPRKVWRDVPYSTPAAAHRLAATLGSSGSVHELAGLSDVDRADDLAVLKDELVAAADLSPQQREMLDWVVETIAQNSE